MCTAADINCPTQQTDTNSDPLFHNLDIPGQKIPCPHEGLRDNKTNLVASIYSLN